MPSQTTTSSLSQLELDRPACLLLYDCRPRSNPAAADDLADLHFDDIAATQLAVDGKVEHGPVAQPPFSVEPKPYRPYLLRLQRALWSNHAPGIPRPSHSRFRVELRMSHVVLLLAGSAIGEFSLCAPEGGDSRT